MQKDVCEHLYNLDKYIQSKGIKETFRGKAWSDNSRIYVYYDVVLDCETLRQKLKIDECVIIDEYLGTHGGSEKGFHCTIHKDGIMGLHPCYAKNAPVIS